MKVLIADDDRTTRRLLEAILIEWDYTPVVACDGVEAWELLQDREAPQLALLDWVMPRMDGLEVCRKIRAEVNRPPCFLILLTVRGSRKDIVAGLQGGADDYVTKPFDIEELQARIHNGSRLVDLQNRLAAQVRHSEEALAKLQSLQALLSSGGHVLAERN